MNEILLVLEACIIFASVVICKKLFGEIGVISWVVIATILANVITAKNANIFGLSTAIGTVMFASTFLATDILSECYSRESAKKAVYLGLFADIILIISTQIALRYIPSEFDYADSAMQTLFALNLRISIASAVMYFIANLGDIYIFNKLRDKTNGSYLWVRNNVSTILCNCLENWSKKMEIKTETLKAMLSKAVKGAGNNKLLPITGLMKLTVAPNELWITTTNMVNFLTVKGNLSDSDEFNGCVIEVEKFAKLVSKMTCEYVTINDKGNYLEVVGNGKYQIEIPLDENGERIVYPDPVNHTHDELTVKRAIIDLVLNTCKPSLATTLEVPVYTNYYIGKEVLATDTFTISALDIEMFKDKKLLMSADLMDLIGLIESEDVKFTFADENYVYVSGGDVVVYGKLEDGIEEYAVDAISQLAEQEFDSVCKFKKSEMLSTLDRIALFVGAYDDRAVRLTFTENGINVESKQANSIETIPYVASENFTQFTCMINVDMLSTQLKANMADVIEMQYGAENSVKLVDGAVTQVIALLEE